MFAVLFRGRVVCREEEVVGEGPSLSEHCGWRRLRSGTGNRIWRHVHAGAYGWQLGGLTVARAYCQRVTWIKLWDFHVGAPQLVRSLVPRLGTGDLGRCGRENDFAPAGRSLADASYPTRLLDSQLLEFRCLADLYLSSTPPDSTMLPTRANYVHILVPVKRAIDYAVKVRIAKDGKGVDTSVKHSMVSY